MGKNVSIVIREQKEYCVDKVFHDPDLAEERVKELQKQFPDQLIYTIERPIFDARKEENLG